VTATADGFLPYAPTLSNYVTADEIATRYANLAAFEAEYGHFFIGTGPMVLTQVDALAGITVLENNADYFLETGTYVGRGFDDVAIPEVAVAQYDETVIIGSPAAFNIDVTFGGEAYAADNIKDVVWILLDATGQIAQDGKGEVIADGKVRVLIADTSALPAGANRLEIVVVPKTVVLPGTSSVSFTTL